MLSNGCLPLERERERVFMWESVQMCMLVMFIMCTCVCMGARGQFYYAPSAIYTLYLRYAWNSPRRLDWLVSTCLLSCLLSAVIAIVHHHTWVFKEPWHLGEQDSGPHVWKANTLHAEVSPEAPALITKEINEIHMKGLLLLPFSLRKDSRREIAEAPTLCYRTLASCWHTAHWQKRLKR